MGSLSHGMLLGSSVGPGIVSISSERGGINCRQPLIWTNCLNSTQLANASLQPVLLSCTTLHGSHSPRQLCFHWQIQARGWARPSPEGTSSFAHATRPLVPSLWIHRLCFLSLSTLQQILVRSDARTAKCIVINPVSLLPTTLSPQAFPPPHKQGAQRWGGRGRGRGGMQKQIQTSSPVFTMHIREHVHVGGGTGNARWTAGQRTGRVLSPSPTPSCVVPRCPAPHPSHAVLRCGREVAV